MIEKAQNYISKERMYDITGIQFMDFNTVFQLLSLKENRPYILDEAETLLFTPDLLNYMLTGAKSTEYSIATTSQMVDLKTNDWSDEIINALGLPKRLLTKIVPTGAKIGTLSDEICEELSLPKADVIAVAARVDGTVIRKLRGPSASLVSGGGTALTSVDWDLKNHKGLPISGGVYLIHIKADGVGEKLIKWFGSLRPVDLNSFQ
jgi:ribulose kinase